MRNTDKVLRNRNVSRAPFSSLGWESRARDLDRPLFYSIKFLSLSFFLTLVNFIIFIIFAIKVIVI